jgi:putative endopeptidase
MPNTRRRSRTTKSEKGVPTQPHIPRPRESIKPGTDFYLHVNAEWLRHVNMPPYRSSYGVSEEIEDLVNKELLEILDTARQEVSTKADKNIPHTPYLLGTLTESALNNKSQDLNVKFVKSLVGSLRCLRDSNDIGHTLGDFIKYRVKCIFSFIVVPSEVDSTIQRLAIGPGELGLPDPTYYKQAQSGKNRILAAYSKLLQNLSADFEVTGLEQVITIEYDAAVGILAARQDEEILMTGSELMKQYSAIPWEQIFQNSLGWSLDKFRGHQILILSRKWLLNVNTWFKTLNLDTWKVWLSSAILLHLLPLLPPPYDNWEFELFGHRLRGQSEKMPQRRLALRLAEEWLTGSLGDVYIRKFVSPTVKTQASSIAEEIRRVAADQAGSTEWLEPKTRRIAFEKVKNIYLGVAYPDKIVKDKKTHLDPEQLVKNVLSLAELDFVDEMKKINTPLKPAEWDDSVFAVNAYYYNEGNRLILPAGILRWPFFDIAAGDGWNFGGLGATIGHEITHAFDNDGKDYDEFGNKNPWCSKAETERYYGNTNALIRLYNKTQYFGHHLNGHLTLSENIADLGGVSIALEALKRRLKARKVSVEQTKKEICDFFISFAVSWRTKDKKEKALQSLFMDVHAPPQARVNNIVRQFDDWYECFDVKPGDKLYSALENRIKIF